MAGQRTSNMAAGVLMAALALTCATGCPVVDGLPAPGRVETQREVETGRLYHLYVPSRYTPEGRWPLVISCHGTPPWDTAERQLDEWKGLAEKKGFLLAAPELIGTRGDFPPPPEEQIRRQLEDEEAILAIVRAIKGSRTVEDTRVFLTGWSGGGYAVFFTGIRHPDVFRALAVRQGNFDAAFVEPCIPFLDRYQPILIMYGADDILMKSQCLASFEWLRAHDLQPKILERPGFHRRDRDPVFTFFADVVRQTPWIRVSAQDNPTDPLEVTFSLRASFVPDRYLWDFGDDQPRSPLSAPRHRFEKPGLYAVKVAVYPAKGEPYVRQVELQIPRPRLGTSLPSTP